MSPLRGPAVLVVTSVFLTVCVVGSGTALALSPAAPASGTLWAYGAVRSLTFSGQAGTLHGFDGRAMFGVSVILNETNDSVAGSPTVYALHLTRTMGAFLEATFCVGRCSSNNAVANFSYHSWETANAWVNLTTNGTVTSTPGGGDLQAVALLNSSVAVTAFLRESGALLHGSSVYRALSLAVNVSGKGTINLSSPLGLFPLTIVPGTEWTASSEYELNGSVGWSGDTAVWGTGVVHPRTVPLKGGNASITAHGPLTVTGAYPTGSVFTFGGYSFPALNLTVVGPFALREGVVLVPVAADLFGSSAQPWTNDTNNSSAQMSTSRVDVHPGASYDGHLPFVASSTSWYASAADPSQAVVPTGSGPAPALLTPPSDANSTSVVQAQPESVAQAQSDQNCLITGASCPSGASPFPWARAFLLAGVGAVAVAVVSLVLVTRRRAPPPVYPNASLYPPGAAGTAVPPNRPIPKPTEDDPLSHLW